MYTSAPSPLFSRGGITVTLDGSLSLAPASEKLFLDRLARSAQWFRRGRDGVSWKPTSPPRDVKEVVAAEPPPLSPLDTVTACPVFGADGSLLASPGYHPKAHTWIERCKELDGLSVQTLPTEADTKAAVNLLLDDLLHDFPFAAPSDQAHALALLLLPFARQLVAGPTPLHLIDAPAPGSGKSLLVTLGSILLTGRAAHAQPVSRDEEERRKVIMAQLLTGRPLTAFDNAKEGTRLDSPVLAGVLTSTIWSDRFLGESRQVHAENRALWTLTANNLRLSGELARRAVRIHLDTKTDRPFERKGFKHPLPGWAHEHRRELVEACLTIIQAWVAAGRPRGKESLGNFEEWAAVMGGILDVARVEGFLASQEELYANLDDDSTEWRHFIQLWHDTLDAEPKTAKDLVSFADTHSLLADVMGVGTDRSRQSRMGRALQARVDRVFGSLRIETAKHRKGKRYIIVEVAQAQVPNIAEHAPNIMFGTLDTHESRPIGTLPNLPNMDPDPSPDLVATDAPPPRDNPFNLPVEALDYLDEVLPLEAAP